AMKWTKIAWSEVLAEVVSPHDENSVPIVPPISDESIHDVEKTDPNDELAVKKLQQQINILYIHNPILIKDLLNLEEKQRSTLSWKEQLNILYSALRIVDKRIEDGG
ncbi:1084_t:CDS:2, partial [Dentiscutata heterogama]